MLEKIVINNPKELERIKARIKKQGKDKLHVVSDFDRTLTKAFIKGKKVGTVIAQIRDGNYLSPEYVKKAHELYNHYRPIEINPELGEVEKNAKMQEWWEKHFKLLIESGMNKQVIQDIIKKRKIEFRPGVLEFIDFLHESNIPLVIISASVGNMLSEYLKSERRLYDNVHVIANFFEWKGNKAIGVRQPIIHSLNKHEVEVSGLPVYSELKKRRNVLLLGDSLDDLGMVEGFGAENVLKIGFLNEEVEANLALFKENYDVILLGDARFEFVNELVRNLVN